MNQKNGQILDLLQAINWQAQPPEAFALAIRLARETHAPFLAAMLIKQAHELYPEHGLLKVEYRLLYSRMRMIEYKRRMTDEH